MIDQWVDALAKLIAQSSWLAPLIALFAGTLTSFTPCCLTSVPLVIGYVGAGTHNTKKAFSLSLTFAMGQAITFITLGAAASLLGKLIRGTSPIWFLSLGTLMVLMALQTWEIYNFIPSTYLVSKNTKKGYFGAFIAGVLGGIFSTPCSTPVLIVLLGLVARSGNIIWGITLLLFYSIGHSFLVMAAGTSIGFVKKISKDPKYGAFSKISKIIMGSAILLLAFYMFYLAF